MAGNGTQAKVNEFDQKLASIDEATEFLLSRTKQRPKLAVICGTGLGGLADLLTDTDIVAYEEIPHFVTSSVQGHAGRLVFGVLDGVCVVCMQGRVHAYEGHPMWKMTFPIRVFAKLGVQLLLVTNAGGGLNPEYSVGDIMIIKDHINFASLAGVNPFVGLNDTRFGDRFIAMSGAYDCELRGVALRVAGEVGLEKSVQEGVYMCQVGPCFETVAESRMCQQWGADVIGMSTVFEVSVARHVGIRCIGLSLITNLCLLKYNTTQPAASHAETLDTGSKRAEDLKRYVAKLLPQLHTFCV